MVEPLGGIPVDKFSEKGCKSKANAGQIEVTCERTILIAKGQIAVLPPERLPM